MNARIALLYALFAAISTAVNIGTQALVVDLARRIDIANTWVLTTSVIAGTGTGLVCKYLLDKKWIFGFRATNPRHEAQAFFLYTAMGVATTLIYLGMEFAFQKAFAMDAMRYLGGALGLIVGYMVKYQLDRKYSFRTAP